MRAILIDPYARKVERIYDDFEMSPCLYNHYVITDVIKDFPLGPTHHMLIDEIGPFRRDQKWFGIKGMPVSIAGRGLIVASPPEGSGRWASCQMEVDAVSRVISWFDDNKEAEALVPPTVIGTGRSEVIVPFEGFNTFNRVIVLRDGTVIEHVEPQGTFNG